MHNKKGYSLLELLVVLVIMALIIALIALPLLEKINDARGAVIISEARLAYVAGQAVILETKAVQNIISDEDYMAGLTGIIDDASLPVQTMLSHRMSAFLTNSIVMSGKPSTGKACLSFTVINGVITSMSYETILRARIYTVTIANEETTVTYDK